MKSAERVTITDLARSLGLAKSTVSYALNGGPRRVSEEVRAKVAKEAERLGYRANPVALSLATQRTRTIGFVPTSLRSDAMTSPLAQAALQSIYRAAHEKEIHVMLPSGYDPERSEETRIHLLSAPMDGLILLQPTDPQAMGGLKTRGIPMMTMIAPPEGLLPTINADNVGGVRLGVEKLVELGHKRVGCLFSTKNFDTEVRKLTFDRLCSAYSLSTRPEWIVNSDLTFHSGAAAARAVLSQRDRPTALICVNDHVAAGAIRTALELGLRVPQDISIIGFDDDLLARTCIVPITTVRQPIEEMAIAAFEGLLDQIDSVSVPDQILACTLVERASTAPPPGI